MLDRHSFNVSAGRDISDFVTEINVLKPDLILIDKNLGRIDGSDLCKVIKSDEALQDIPVVMFSAYHKTKDSCVFAGPMLFLQSLSLLKNFCKQLMLFSGQQ